MSASWLDAIKGDAPGRMTVSAKQPATGNRLTPDAMISDVDLVQSGSKKATIARHSGRDNCWFPRCRALYWVSANAGERSRAGLRLTRGPNERYA